MIEIDVQEHKNNLVKKNNELIKAQGNLSNTAQKMLATVLSMIRADDTELQEYALKIDEYLELIGSSTENTKAIKQSAEELMRNPFWIDGKLFNWCSYVDIEKIPGYIIFDIHKYLKPYLLEFKEYGNFTKYHIINILTLKGEYTPRLYEYLKMEFNKYKNYKPNAKSYTIELEIEKLRDMFKIPNSYRYNNIKQRIIEKTMQELKEKTDIKFEYEEQKINSKVIRLKITISDNLKGSNDFLATQEKFVAHIRANYKPDTDKKIYPSIAKLKYGGKECYCKIDNNGYLYLQDIENLVNIDLSGQQAKDIWEAIYEATKQNPSFLIPNIK